MVQQAESSQSTRAQEENNTYLPPLCLNSMKQGQRRQLCGLDSKGWRNGQH